MSRGLGFMICKFLHKCRFTIGSDNKRKLRTDCEYYLYSIIGAMFYIVWAPLYLIIMGLLVWPIRATIEIFKNSNALLYIFVPVVWALLIPMYGFILYVCFALVAIYGLTVYCSICRYKSTPLRRRV